MDAVLKIIDTFAGAGGMTLGFGPSSAGRFQSVWANDFNDYAVYTYNANFGNHCISGDIVDILDDPNVIIQQALRTILDGHGQCRSAQLCRKLTVMLEEGKQ